MNSITLANPSSMMPHACIVVHYTSNDPWDITSIEFYFEAEKFQSDHAMGDLPRDVQESIYAGLEAHLARQYRHSRSQGLARLWADIRALNTDSEGVRMIESAQR